KIARMLQLRTNQTLQIMTQQGLQVTTRLLMTLLLAYGPLASEASAEPSASSPSTTLAAAPKPSPRPRTGPSATPPPLLAPLPIPESTTEEEAPMRVASIGVEGTDRVQEILF